MSGLFPGIGIFPYIGIGDRNADGNPPNRT